MLSKSERQRVIHGERKSQEAAQARREAAKAARAATAVVEQSAAWWQQNGPAFRKAFVDKWAAVDWKALAEKDPAEVQEADRPTPGRGSAAGRSRSTRPGRHRRSPGASGAGSCWRPGRPSMPSSPSGFPTSLGPNAPARPTMRSAAFLFEKGIPGRPHRRDLRGAPSSSWRSSAMHFEKAQLALRSRRPRRRRAARKSPRRRHRHASLPDRAQ